jgi:hypothetical protein
MAFPYTTGIPNPPNDPSADVSNMQTNTNTISDWTNVDHVTFNQAAGGQHKQITFANTSSPSTPSDPTSILFTSPGTASSKADLKFVNQNATFPLNSLRAMGSFAYGNGALSAITGFNIASISGTPGTYTITLSANATTGNNVAVLVSDQGGNQVSWTFSSNVLTISAAVRSATVSFAVYQV